MSANAPIAAHPVARWLILIVLAVGVYFFHGFLVPILAALIISFASWPLYKKLVVRCRNKTWLSASIATFLVFLLIIVPLVILVFYTIREVQHGVTWLVSVNRYGAEVPAWIMQLPVVGAYLAEWWDETLNHPHAISELTQLIGLGQLANISKVVITFGGQLFSVLLALLFMLFTLFFVYKDGHSLAQQLDKVGERILPKRWYRVSRVAPTMVSATVTGMTIIAIGEGIVFGFAYWLFGAPSPLTLGIITGVMAMIPGGAPTSMTLVSLYLLGSGHPMAGLGLFAWGAIQLFVVDKTIRPKLVGGPAKLPLLPTLFGLVGGVQTMGIVGLFVGPVVMALLVAIWREWLTEEDDEAPAAAEHPQ
ncbi:MAG: AI-2E family transporter [Burkholderiales bacterium]|jgi:predicted PurR-regulated permease PerM|nr:AI-2E family transporter [Burkholderiales bacterium]